MKKPIKKLTLNKLIISKLANPTTIMGGNGTTIITCVTGITCVTVESDNPLTCRTFTHLASSNC